MLLEHHAAGGFRWRSKLERIGPMKRFIWGFWSVAYFTRKIGVNDLFRAIRMDERKRLRVATPGISGGIPGHCGNCRRPVTKIPGSPYAMIKGGEQYVYRSEELRVGKECQY